jgi:hypothetical protein
VIGRTIAISVVLITTAVACGIPGSSGFEAVGRDDVPFGLADTTTTSTTTTLAPTTTVDATSTTAAIETSTTISTEPVDLFFVSGRQLQPVSITLSRPASPGQVLAALASGPSSFGEVGIGLRSVIPRRAEIGVVETGGVAEVDLPSGVFDVLNATDQRLLFGQIVLTLTRRPGIGQVRFTLAGDPTEVFTGSGDVREPGETVSEEDYLELTIGSTPTSSTTSTTTTTTTPSTTLPPSTVAVQAATTSDDPAATTGSG